MDTPSSFSAKPENNKNPTFHINIKDIEKQLKNMSSYAQDLESEINNLKQQSSCLPQQISSINARLAKLEAGQENGNEQAKLQDELSQTLTRISEDYQQLSAKERSLQGALIKANSEIHTIENALKLEKMKAGTSSDHKLE